MGNQRRRASFASLTARKPCTQLARPGRDSSLNTRFPPAPTTAPTPALAAAPTTAPTTAPDRSADPVIIDFSRPRLEIYKSPWIWKILGYNLGHLEFTFSLALWIF
jgi:hypothetical protein